MQHGRYYERRRHLRKSAGRPAPSLSSEGARGHTASQHAVRRQQRQRWSVPPCAGEWGQECTGRQRGGERQTSLEERASGEAVGDSPGLDWHRPCFSRRLFVSGTKIAPRHLRAVSAPRIPDPPSPLPSPALRLVLGMPPSVIPAFCKNRHGDVVGARGKKGD